MCKYWGLKHEQVWAEFWSVHHIIRVVCPAGASLRVVWIRRKSSLQAQVPARLQPFPYRFFPPLSLLKTHPASLNVTSHHHIVTPDRTLFAWAQDVFFFTNGSHVSSWNANTGLSRTRGCFNHRVSSPDEQASSWPITLRAAILRHVLPTGQGYPEFIQQQVASFMPWREVKRSPVWAPSQTVDEQKHPLSRSAKWNLWGCNSSHAWYWVFF